MMTQTTPLSRSGHDKWTSQEWSRGTSFGFLQLKRYIVCHIIVHVFRAQYRPYNFTHENVVRSQGPPSTS
jgi:hypothetical protein